MKNFKIMLISLILILPLMACQSFPIQSAQNGQPMTTNLPLLTKQNPIIKTILPMDEKDPFTVQLKIVEENDDLQVYETINNIDKITAKHPIPTSHMPLTLYLKNPDGSYKKIEKTIIFDTFGYGENEPVKLDNIQNTLTRSDNYSEFYDMPMGKHEYELWYYGKALPNAKKDDERMVIIKFIWDRKKVSEARKAFLGSDSDRTS